MNFFNPQMFLFPVLFFKTLNFLHVHLYSHLTKITTLKKTVWFFLLDFTSLQIKAQASIR